jgi:hypothetical protein
MYDPGIVNAFMKIVHRLRPGSATSGVVRRHARHGSMWLQARAV